MLSVVFQQLIFALIAQMLSGIHLKFSQISLMFPLARSYTVCDSHGKVMAKGLRAAKGIVCYIDLFCMSYRC